MYLERDDGSLIQITHFILTPNSLNNYLGLHVSSLAKGKNRQPKNKNKNLLAQYRSRALRLSAGQS